MLFRSVIGKKNSNIKAYSVVIHCGPGGHHGNHAVDDLPTALLFNIVLINDRVGHGKTSFWEIQAFIGRLGRRL